MTAKGILNHWKVRGLEDQFQIVRAYQEDRKIQSFHDLPSTSREKILYYWGLARDLVPGRTDWHLAGSYVNGTYIDQTTPPEVRSAFFKMGLKLPFESDVDFYLPSFRGLIRKTLFDIIGFNRRKEKFILMPKKETDIQVITIPPIVNDLPPWDWSGFPDEKIPDLIQAFESKNQSTLITLHNEFKLSENSFCCSGGKVLLYNVEQFIKSLDDETI